MAIEIKRDRGGTRLTISGSADLSLAVDLKCALLDALSSASNPVDIDLTEITTLNVNCLQLICAAQSEAASLGIRLTIVEPKEPAVLEELKEAGLRLPVTAPSRSETYA